MPEKINRKFKIVNIHRNFRRNKDSIIENLIYAELRDEYNQLWIASTLDYILEEVENRGYILVDDKL